MCTHINKKEGKGVQIMNKKSLFVTLLTAGLLITSCGTKVSLSTQSSSSLSSGSSSSSNSNIDVESSWSPEEEELLEKYCGEVIPYPEGFLFGEVTVEEVVEYDDYYDEYYHLEISDEGTNFTLEEYYIMLEEAEWNTIKTYSGNIVQTDTSGTDFVELTKAGEENGFEILYLFQDAYKDNEGNTVSSANIIRCYNDLYSKPTSATSWKEDEVDTIKYITTTALPFIKVGGIYQLGCASSDILVIRDNYVEDLTSDYANLLKNDGFVLDTDYSKKYDQFILVKQLNDGSYLLARLYYFAGNVFYITYIPNEKEHKSWPSDIVEEIKKATGVTVPTFEVAENGTYITYKKNDTYHIYTTDLSDDFDYDEYNGNQLQILDLNWEETISFKCYYLVDDYYNAIGFGVGITVTTPTSTFTASWPKDVIDDVIKNTLDINDVTLLDFEGFTLPKEGKNVKYEIYGQEVYQTAYEYYYDDIKEYPFLYDLADDASDEEIKALADSLAKKEMGIKVSVYDVDAKAYETYEAIFENGCWYKSYDEYGYTYFEDPTGTLAITLTSASDPSHNDEGLTTFFIHYGSGEEHTPELSFNNEEVEMVAGQSTDFYYSKSMLPYDVTFSADNDKVTLTEKDEYVEVKLDESVEVGTSIVITATITDKDGKTYTATSTITVVDAIYYTPTTAIDAVNELIKAKGYEPTLTYATKDEDGKFLNLDTIELNLGKDVSADEIKNLVTSSFTIEGFTPLVEEDDEDDWDDDYWDDDFNANELILNNLVSVKSVRHSETDEETSETTLNWKAESLPYNGEEIESEFIMYVLSNEFCMVDVEYHVFTYQGDVILLIYTY